MSWLEVKGAEVAIRRAKRFANQLAAKAVKEINTHTTKELEKLMSEFEDLRGAVDQELADDSAQNQLIAQLQQALADAQAAGADDKAALDEALATAVELTERLRSNDPAPTEAPVDEPHPDQTLPGDLP